MQPSGDTRARRAFREFVRAHHPDAGGDAEVFVAGLAAFGRGASARTYPPGRRGGGEPDPRFDGPVVFVHQPAGPRAVARWARDRLAARHRPPRVR